MDKNTNQIVEDFHVENMLENWQKKALDDKALLTAQSRVWSKISGKISDSDQIKTLNYMSNQSNFEAKNQSSSFMPSNSKSPKPWFFRPLGVSFIALFLILIIVAITGTSYIKTLQDKLNQKQLQVVNSSNPTNSNPDYAKMDLSLEEIRSQAKLKLNKLTNGVSLDEINSSVSKSPVPATIFAEGRGSAGENGKPADNTAPTSSPKETSGPTADVLAKEKGIVDNTVYYTETIITESNGGYTFSYLQNYSGFNSALPIKSQSWVSANYSKYIISQNDKILNYNVYTPEYSVSYLNGKYAIKELFDQKFYLSGVGDMYNVGGGYSQISFLKSILNDISLKDDGNQVLDGKNVKVLSTDKSKLPPEIQGVPNDVYTMKYYIDQANISLYKIENFKNDKIVSSAIQSDYKEYTNPDLNKLFGTSDLGSTPVKEVKAMMNNQDTNSFVEAITQANIFYPSSLSVKFLEKSLYVSGNDSYTETESVKLRNSKDFDPSLDENYLKSLQNQAFITFGGIYFLSGAVFKQEPVKEPNQVIKKDLKKTIQINGKSVEARLKTFYYESTPSPEVPTPDLSTRLEFKFSDGLWYQLTEYKPLGSDNSQSILDAKNIDLVSLNSQDALQIDQFQKAQKDSFPQLDPNVKLDSISSDIRLLPGDLKSKYKLTATSVAKSNRSGNLATCDKYLVSSYDLESCLMEKYNGFRLYFNQILDINSGGSNINSTSNYLNFTVLDVSFESLPLQSFVDTLNDSSFQGVTNLLEIDKKQAKISSTPFGSNNSYYFFPVKGKTIMLYGNLNQLEMEDIAKKIDFDKGLAELKNQLNSQSQNNLGGVSDQLSPNEIDRITK